MFSSDYILACTFVDYSWLEDVYECEQQSSLLLEIAHANEIQVSLDKSLSILLSFVELKFAIKQTNSCVTKFIL